MTRNKTLCILCTLLLLLSAGLSACGKQGSEGNEAVSGSADTVSSGTDSAARGETPDASEAETQPAENRSDADASLSESEAPSSEEADSAVSASENSPENPGAETPEPAESMGLFIVTSETGANLREAPNTDSRVFGYLPFHAGGEVLRMEGEWLYVETGGIRAYLYAPLAVTGGDAEALAPSVMSRMARVTEASANIRDAASLESNVIGSAVSGDTFPIVGEEGDFYIIGFDGGNAYLSKTVCSEEQKIPEAEIFPEAWDVTDSEEAGTESESESASETENPENTEETPESPAEETPAPETIPEETPAPEAPAEETPAETADPVYEAAMNSGSAPQAIIQGSNGLTVCIDAGHQQAGMPEMEPNGPGSTVMKAKLTTGTAGCVTGIPEYQTVLSVALLLQNELSARGYTVVMIRTTHDCPVSNAERAVIANEYGSSCFIRLHCNSVTDPSVTGVISYAPAPGNPYMDAGVVEQSINFANILTTKTAEQTGAQNRGIIQDNSMTGINWCKVPVSIIEMGFSSNETEDRLLNDPSYQALLAQGMANGIDAFFGR